MEAVVDPVVAIKELRTDLALFGAAFAPELLFASDCQTVLREAAVIEKIAATIVSMAAARVAETDVWERSGARSAAHAIAHETGTSIGAARDRLEAAAKLKDLPAVEDAARKGELSREQTAAIADAAAANPNAEADLIGRAKESSLKELRDECQRVKAAADPTPEETRRRIHKNRSLREWIDAEGAWNLHARGTIENGAEIAAALRPFWEQLATRSRSSDTPEPLEASGFDALVELARWAHHNSTAAAAPGSDGDRDSGGAGDPDGEPDDDRYVDRDSDGVGEGIDGEGIDGEARSLFDDDPGLRPRPAGPAPPGHPPTVRPPSTLTKQPAKLIWRVDLSAYTRGHAIDGETCDIAGVGPIPVSAVRDLLATNPFMAAVIADGRQIMGVAHLGRAANARQRTALEWLTTECSRLGCPALAREVDHRHPYAADRQTELSNLDPLCTHDHDLKTHHGWALVPGTGKRPMVPPDDPRHPDRRD